MKAYIKTFGCQMNEQDSEIMKGSLLRAGYDPVSDPDEADLILVNTCSIREKAYHKAMSEIGRYLQRKKKKTLMGITGCIASQEGAGILKKKPYVDFVLGTDHLGRLTEVVEQARESGKRASYSDFVDISDYEFPAPLEIPGIKKAKAYVTITKGCDNTCSFCIVPMTRGPEVSRSSDEIIREIQGLEHDGVKEIMLLGQNVNSYGKGLSEKINFPKLIRRIASETGIMRIRFTSPHPKDLSQELIREYEENEKLCPHIHLPVQSGSDRILKKMQRAYSREVYLRKVRELRRARPDIAITTDIIVGFPGESETDFQETLDLVREVRYDQNYSFIFSPRPGTIAAAMIDETPLEVKQRRLYQLQDLQKEISLQSNRSRIGCLEEVLVEGASLEGGNQSTGRSLQGRIVNFDGASEKVGDILKIMIREASAFSLKGEVFL